MEDELKKAGLLGKGVSELTVQVLNTMREHPGLLKLSLFNLQYIDLQGQQCKGPSSPCMPSSLALSNMTMASNGSALTFASDFTTASLHRVFDTPLNGVWDAVGDEAKGSLSPIVIWVGIIPGSTSANTTHKVFQEILILLRKNRVNDAIVELHEAGPPPMHHVHSSNATHYVHYFLTALLSGTLILWFHKNKDKDSNPSNKVYRISNCHVLCKNITVNYEHRGSAPMDHIQHSLNEIMNAIADYIITLQVKERQDTENTKVIRVMKSWTNSKLHHNIGHVQYAAAISVNIKGSTLYTLDWAAFSAAEVKVSDKFEGNIVDLRSMFCPLGGGSTTFKFPNERKLRVEGCATKEDLTHSAEFDSQGQHCLIVSKDGNTTGLTVGCYASLVSFTLNEVSIQSIKLSIYNLGDKTAKVFSTKGDSGSLVWHMTNGKAHIIGQLHSEHNKGGSTSNHVTYCTPGWYLLGQIKTRFKHADFYCTTWSV
ncbi:hypothetical protein DFH29DRAFT_984263 [Suillus ampliporus]|nr:hypothetical protein DFH29DRAFT_984263 [Suillus ampliporus]